MNKKFAQALNAFMGPLLTLAFGQLALHYFRAEDRAKAVGAAVAALVGFLLVQSAEQLPQKFLWWRMHFDSRSEFEGWWLQIHEDRDRAAVFSFLHAKDGDTYGVEGNAFDSHGAHLAQWASLQVFFSRGLWTVSYLWNGIAYEPDGPAKLEGTTNMRALRSSGWTRSRTGVGEVQHLSLARTMHFTLRRIDPEFLCSLGLKMGVDELNDIENRRTFVRAWLNRVTQ